MTWQGIDRGITSVSEDMGASEYQQNTRMTVKGELQRRPGMAPANFSPQGTAALGMAGAFPTSGPYGMIVDTAGTVNGFPITMPIWQSPQLRPPIPQGQPAGNGWAMTASFGGPPFAVAANTPCGGVQNSPTCAGSIIVRVSYAGAIPGETFGQIQRGGGPIIDRRMLTGGPFNYTVAVPFSATGGALIFSTDTTNAGGNAAALTISPSESKSDAGCSLQWDINTAVGGITAITQFSAFSYLTCTPLGCDCIGKITLSFSAITTPALVVAYRTNGIGGTLIFDSRTVMAGSTTYTIDVPANVIFRGVTISIDPQGGVVAGTIVGQAAAGCG